MNSLDRDLIPALLEATDDTIRVSNISDIEAIVAYRKYIEAHMTNMFSYEDFLSHTGRTLKTLS